MCRHRTYTSWTAGLWRGSRGCLLVNLWSSWAQEKAAIPLRFVLEVLRHVLMMECETLRSRQVVSCRQQI